MQRIVQRHFHLLQKTFLAEEYSVLDLSRPPPPYCEGGGLSRDGGGAGAGARARAGEAALDLEAGKGAAAVGQDQEHHPHPFDSASAPPLSGEIDRGSSPYVGASAPHAPPHAQQAAIALALSEEMGKLHLF